MVKHCPVEANLGHAPWSGPWGTLQVPIRVNGRGAIGPASSGSGRRAATVLPIRN